VTVAIETFDDIVDGRPIPRETVRSVDRGYLVTCTATHCEWQGLFPDPNLAATAAEHHYDQQQRHGQHHHGTKTYTVVELLDAETACTLDESTLGLTVEELRLGTVDGDVREWEFPRTIEAVDELVAKGDRIRTTVDEQKVIAVSETRAHGLPTWSVIYCDLDADPTDGNTKRRFANELVAQDGAVYQSYGPEPLSAPAFEVIGTAEHQADLGAFAGAPGGESA